MSLDWLAPFQAVSRTAPIRVLLEAVSHGQPSESQEFLKQLDKLEDLEVACPWERSYSIKEGRGGTPPPGDPEPPEEGFGARILRERQEQAAAEEYLQRTGEPALPPCRPQVLSSEEYTTRNEQAKELRKLREDLISQVPSETVQLCSHATSKLEQLESDQSSVLECGSDGVYAGKGNEVHAAFWLRMPPVVSAEPRQVDMILCVDTSGSMKQDMPVVRSVLTKLVRRARPKDRLCVITFDSKAVLQVGWTECNAAGKKQLHDIVGSLEADGRTAFIPALERIFEQLHATQNRPVQVVFLSDGKPDDSAYEICCTLRRRLPPVDVSLSTVAFGEKSDSALLSLLSHMGRGHHIYVTGMMMVGSAIGRLYAWAQYMAGESFAVLRGLSGCRILDIEEGYGEVRLKDGAKSCLLLLGSLLHSQRRTIALRLALPKGVRGAEKDLEMPLAECTFLMRRATQAASGVQVSRCQLKAMQVPSLLIEGLLGFPLHIHLEEDSHEAFGEERQGQLARTLSTAMGVQEGALVVDRVRKGSAIVDAHVALPPSEALQVLRKLNLVAVENCLRQEGFAVGTGGHVEVPGQVTAQRWLQWAAANHVAEKPQRKVSAVADLNGGPLGSLDQRTAAAVGQDIWSSGLKELHWRLQLQAAHLRAFASDPEAHVSLRAYDSHELRQGAQALDSRNGAPVHWLQILPGAGGDAGHSLLLKWDGELQGPHWLVTLEPEGPGSEILTCFRHFDQNGDGVISPEELAFVLQAVDPQAWTQDRTNALLHVIDTNGDGLVQYNEFVSWLTEGDDSWDQLRQDIGIARETAQRLNRSRVQIAHGQTCTFEGLAADVYRVTVKGADMRGRPGMYGQCWVCLGLGDVSPVVALLESQEGPGALLPFSPVSWIGWGTARSQQQ